MRSRTVAVKMPNKLMDAYERFAPKAGYPGDPNLAAKRMMIWNPLYAMMVGGEHIITAEIAKMSPEAQDAFVDRVVDAWERGETSHGNFLARVLEDVVKEFKLPVNPHTVGTLVSHAVRKRK